MCDHPTGSELLGRLERQNALTNASWQAAREAVLEVFGVEHYDEWVKVWARRSTKYQAEVLALVAVADEIADLPTTESE